MHASLALGDEGDEEYERQPRFRSYREEIATVIQSFDKAREWADLIKCLQRLMKVLETYAQFPRAVPCKLLLAKRLAQCLNPSLPSGVHLKTLDVYAQIFSRLGNDKIATDLPVYSHGLFPLFQFASTQVKPAIMEIYRSHYLPLGPALRPCLPGLLLALLPGIDDETSEFYQPVLVLLDDIRRAVNDDQAFFHALWKNLLTSPPTIRISAMNYLITRLPSSELSKHTDLLPERNTLVLMALVNTLADSSVMVLRVALDLLLQHFPLHHNVFPRTESAILMRAAILVLTRREMSLNRRLFSWILPSGGSAAASSLQYFHTHSKPFLIRALKSLFAEDAVDLTAALRPYKVVTSLMHKDEIGNLIVDDVLEFLVLNLYRYRRPHAFSTEVFRYARSVLDEIVPESIFSFFASYIECHCGSNDLAMTDDRSSLDVVNNALNVLQLENREAMKQLPALIFALLRVTRDAKVLPARLLLATVASI